MREFVEIQQDLGLKFFLESDNGNLYFVPIAPDAARLLVRRFDRNLAPALIPAYVDLLSAAQRWIESDPDLSGLVRVEQPNEIGRDFIARQHHLGDSLRSFLDTDPEDNPPEPPDELALMQTRFRERAKAAGDVREALLVSILACSIVEPSAKTLYSYRESRFVVVDLKPTRADLERWVELSAR